MSLFSSFISVSIGYPPFAGFRRMIIHVYSWLLRTEHQRFPCYDPISQVVYRSRQVCTQIKSRPIRPTLFFSCFTRLQCQWSVHFYDNTLNL